LSRVAQRHHSIDRLTGHVEGEAWSGGPLACDEPSYKDVLFDTSPIVAGHLCLDQFSEFSKNAHETMARSYSHIVSIEPNKNGDSKFIFEPD
jgi:hypothetical protein